MRKYSIAASIIIVVASIVAIASAWHDSPIVDEIPHIGSGYSYVADNTYQFNPEHPPLAKDLAGLALLPLGINSQFLSNYNTAHPNTINDQWNFGRTLIFNSGINPTTLIHFAKLPLILFFIFSGWLVYVWTRKTYNSRAALLAVFLFAFSPTIIAHSRFVTTDIAALFGVLFATHFFVRYLKEQNSANFWLASSSFGVALLTKFSTFLLIPFFLLLALIWAWSQHHEFFKPVVRLVLKSTLIMIVGFVVIVGPIYQLHIFNYPPTQQKNDTATILKYYPIPAVANIIIWASDKPILRPYAQWSYGMAMVFQRASGGNRTYFLNQVSSASFKSYFPIVYSIKEPIPFLILLICAIWFGFRFWRKERRLFKEKIKEHFLALTMFLWIFIYLAASINANLNIGIRHLIPIYGFIFILVAGQIEAVLTNKKWFRIFVFILLGWYLAEFASIYPYYLTYFNEFAGGPPGGHKYVVDSNLDWGQDLWRLGDFVKQNNIQKIYTDYFGWADPIFYMGSSFEQMHSGQYTSTVQFLRDNPSGGWIAVSATFYQEVSINPAKSYEWLGKPTATIGNSIFVWHITP